MYATIDHNSPSQSIPSMTGNFSTFGNVSDSSSPLSYGSISINDSKPPMSNKSTTNSISKIEKSIIRWRSKHEEHKEQYKEAAAHYINESRKEIQRQHYKYLEDMIRKHQEFLVIRPEDVSERYPYPNYKWTTGQKRNYYSSSMSFNSQGPSYYQPNISSNNNVHNVSYNYYNYPDPNMHLTYPEPNVYTNYPQPMVDYEVRNQQQILPYQGCNDDVYNQQGNFLPNQQEKFW
uniref:HMG box domain-containing protein n=1 Tax=Strongyloides venezuelensis TaxID=75913 RepID=A0A0K0FLM3_STRVS